MKCDSRFRYRIQELIDAKKISQREFAGRLSINEARVSDWINGNVASPRRTTLRKISDTFGCSIEWLATGEGEPFSESKKKSFRVGHSHGYGSMDDQQERDFAKDQLVEFLNKVLNWQEDNSDFDSIASMNFMNEFNEKFPEFVNWLKKQKKGDT